MFLTKKNTTLIIFALLLGVYIFTTNTPKKSKNLNFSPDEASGIILKNYKTDIVFSKKNNVWFIQEPFIIPADKNLLLKIVGTFSNLNIIRVLEENPSQEQLEQYGLKNPAIEIKFLLSNGSSYSIYFGNKLELGGGVYAKKSGEQRILFLNQDFVQMLDNNLDFFRTKQVVDFDIYEVNYIEYKFNDKTIILAQDNNKWEIIEGDKRFFTDYGEVISYLNNLSFVDYKSVIADRKDDIKKYKLENPLLDVVIKTKEKEIGFVIFDFREDEYIIKNKEYDSLYLIDKKQFDNIVLDLEELKTTEIISEEVLKKS